MGNRLTYTEVHALWWGYIRGLWPTKPEPRREESRAEPHYWVLGNVIGTILRYSLFMVIGGAVL